MQTPQGRAGAAGVSLLVSLVLAASCTSSGASNDTDPSAPATGGSVSNGDDGASTGNPPGSGGSLSLDPTGATGGAGDDTVTGVSPSDACAQSSEATSARPAVLELVVDTSGSMDWPPGWAPESPDDSKPAGPTKWEITRDALSRAVAALPDEVGLGAMFYPNVEQEPNQCLREEVALPITALGSAGSAPRQRWESALAAVEPVGATPTHGAYRFGLSKLSESTLEGDKFLLLITDGTPTCDLDCNCTEDNEPVDPVPLVREAGAARVGGIRTFVIGSPGSEQARDVLSRLATEGGTSTPGCSDSGPAYCHFDMSTEPDLASGLARALGAITAQVRSCSYPIPAPPHGESLDPDRVNVLFTPSGQTQSETIARAAATSADCDEGWQYASDGQSVVLCGRTCDRVQADEHNQVQILFGCETVVQAPR